MNDIDKIINALEICFTPGAKCKECPYDFLGAVPNCTKGLGADVIALLKEQWQIVRCKDCKHYHPGFTCDLMQKPIMKGDDYFCADGERKVIDNVQPDC